MLEQSPDWKRRSSSKKRKTLNNCCWVFSLSSGVVLIAILDLVAAAFFAATLVYALVIENEQESDLEFFYFITDGIIATLFFFKSYYGLKFLNLSCFSTPKMTEEIQESKDPKLRYKIYVIKQEKRILNNFYMVSVMVYCFMFIQSVSLLFTFSATLTGETKIFGMMGFALFSMVYTQRKILQLLNEKD